MNKALILPIRDIFSSPSLTPSIAARPPSEQTSARRSWSRKRRGLTPDLRTYRGWDEVRAYLEGLHKFWEQAHIEVRRIAWADASLAAVTIRTTLTGRGSSVEVATDGGNLIEFRDGRVVRMIMYRTPDEALEAAGLGE